MGVEYLEYALKYYLYDTFVALYHHLALLECRESRNMYGRLKDVYSLSRLSCRCNPVGYLEG